MTKEPFVGNNRRIIALAEERLKKKIVEEIRRRQSPKCFLNEHFSRGYDTALEDAIDIVKNITTKR